MRRILFGLSLLLSSPWGTLWVPHRQAPEHFMIELQGPGCCRLVPGSFLKQDLEMVILGPTGYPAREREDLVQLGFFSCNLSSRTIK